MIDNLFLEYADIARKADLLFKSIQEKYSASVKCRVRCCDCCNAIFGVFPIEAAYINYHFNRLERKVRRDALRRAEKAEAEMLKAKERLKVFEDDPKMKVFGLGKQRVRCPLLQDSEECALYENRPIICRVYGVPYTLKKENKEVSYVCGISNFEEKASYPAVKLDNIYHKLVKLSMDMMTEAGYLNPAAKADLMLPLERVLRMPFDDIMKGNFGE
jgi:Fe-S-cluster containining protein